ncbi:MAG: hypothetical protein U5N53_22690 [Mycobacterium sp.]|nr:hypothetical protein [Mycobacterium sp.]
MVTTLGFIFLAGYIIAFCVNRRIGVLAVAAAAIPFNDSAAIIIGSIPITPFYVGMIVYLPLVYLRIGFPRPGSSLPFLLAFWSCAITLLGPALFTGMPVVASGLGLDVQVNRLADLDYSSSNFAQIVYLILNLALLMALAGSNDTKKWIPPVPAVVGTAIAVLAWWFHRAGWAWPDELFHNNTRNAYAYVDTARLSGQFSEPSHLAVFALTSAVLLIVTVAVHRPRLPLKLLLLLTATFDILLIVESASATALAGAAIFAMAFVGWSIYRMVATGARVSRGVSLVVIAAVGTLVVLSPLIVRYALDVLEYKLATGFSIRGRTAADLSSLRVFLDSATVGVGLGSNRASSLLLLLLSTVGLVGATLFFLTMGTAIRDGIRDRMRRPWAAGLAVLLFTSLVSLADLVSPMMWLLAGFCWNARRACGESISPAAALEGAAGSAQGGTLTYDSKPVPPKPRVAED